MIDYIINVNSPILKLVNRYYQYFDEEIDIPLFCFTSSLKVDIMHDPTMVYAIYG